MNDPIIRIYGNVEVANRAMDSMRSTVPLTVSIPELGVTLEALVVQVSGPLYVGSSVWEIELRQVQRIPVCESDAMVEDCPTSR